MVDRQDHKDIEIIQKVAELQVIQETLEVALKEHESKNGELTISLQTTHQELGEARKETTKSKASVVVLLLQGAGFAGKLQTAVVDSADLKGALKASREAVQSLATMNHTTEMEIATLRRRVKELEQTATT
ncbi:hypothetical protein R1flu_021929 [Riccia fluitans]|uniref:Uncharacterized protein n=1 Tax=Riccia fluitans TaxID=41844 RepID=A0ABD1ZSF6_9MARC